MIVPLIEAVAVLPDHSEVYVAGLALGEVVVDERPSGRQDQEACKQQAGELCR